MSEYSRVFGSNFPNSLFELKEYKDLAEAPADVQEIAKQFYAFASTWNLAGASALYETNKDKLDPYYLNMNTINKMGEELYNAEVFIKYNSTIIIDENEPNISDYPNCSIWLKPVEEEV